MHGRGLLAHDTLPTERSAFHDAAKLIRASIPPGTLMGYHAYFALRDKFGFDSIDIRTAVSQQWSSHVRVGESVALDEKQLHFRGKSKFIHMNRSKPDPVGHMVCMLSTHLQDSTIPFTCGIYPYMTNKKLEIQISAATLMIWVNNLIEKMFFDGVKPLVVNDCLYTTKDSRAALVSEKCRFLSAQKAQWWSDMDSFLGSHVYQPGDTAYAWNSASHLVVCCHYSDGIQRRQHCHRRQR